MPNRFHSIEPIDRRFIAGGRWGPPLQFRSIPKPFISVSRGVPPAYGATEVFSEAPSQVSPADSRFGGRRCDGDERPPRSPGGKNRDVGAKDAGGTPSQ